MFILDLCAVVKVPMTHSTMFSSPQIRNRQSAALIRAKAKLSSSIHSKERFAAKQSSLAKPSTLQSSVRIVQLIAVFAFDIFIPGRKHIFDLRNLLINKMSPFYSYSHCSLRSLGLFLKYHRLFG
jgi:hypothetical protein